MWIVLFFCYSAMSIDTVDMAEGVYIHNVAFIKEQLT